MHPSGFYAKLAAMARGARTGLVNGEDHFNPETTARVSPQPLGTPLRPLARPPYIPQSCLVAPSVHTRLHQPSLNLVDASCLTPSVAPQSQNTAAFCFLALVASCPRTSRNVPLQHAASIAGTKT